jgi:hypothetical protein
MPGKLPAADGSEIFRNFRGLQDLLLGMKLPASGAVRPLGRLNIASLLGAVRKKLGAANKRKREEEETAAAAKKKKAEAAAAAAAAAAKKKAEAEAAAAAAAEAAKKAAEEKAKEPTTTDDRYINDVRVVSTAGSNPIVIQSSHLETERPISQFMDVVHTGLNIMAGAPTAIEYQARRTLEVGTAKDAGDATKPPDPDKAAADKAAADKAAADKADAEKTAAAAVAAAAAPAPAPAPAPAADSAFKTPVKLLKK